MRVWVCVRVWVWARPPLGSGGRLAGGCDRAPQAEFLRLRCESARLGTDFVYMVRHKQTNPNRNKLTLTLTLTLPNPTCIDRARSSRYVPPWDLPYDRDLPQYANVKVQLTCHIQTCSTNSSPVSCAMFLHKATHTRAN